MGTHTSGPWEAVMPEDPRGQPAPFYSGLVALVSMDPPIGINAKSVAVVAGGGYASEEQWRANARLIAAAPDLLEALREVEWVGTKLDDLYCVSCGGRKADGHDRDCMTRLAIAKAEGRQ